MCNGMPIHHINGEHISISVNGVHKSLIPIQPYLGNIKSGFYQTPL